MDSDQEEIIDTVKVMIECPDCSNDYMIKAGEKMDIINRRMKKVLKCPQCRRWMFHDDA
jgi:Zn finger protein HypA/HybF involved in hydrogenase expression